MGKLNYTANISLDGYICDAEGKFDWSMPDEETHSFINDLERGAGTLLLGRKLYDVLKVWDQIHRSEDNPAIIADYASIWSEVHKIVYSTTMIEPETGRTEVRSVFDEHDVRLMKEASEADLSIGGAMLAAQALRAGLVDEIHFIISPIIVGGGKRALPDGLRLELKTLRQRSFASGVAYLGYRVSSAS
jgi:dihydrofolate reductase